MKRLSVNGLRRQAGVTILEFIAFIGLAALVIAGALGLYNSASSGAKSNDLLTATTSVATSIRSVAAGASGNPAVLNTQFTLPAGWALGGANTTITRQGNTIVWTNSANGTFTLVLTAQSAESTRPLVNKSINGIVGIVVNNVVTWTAIPY